ncbi:MAG: DVUA0089 family protein [Candidatus Acidiferrales bacterium]
MKSQLLAFAAPLILMSAQTARADSQSFTGTLASSTSTYEATYVVTGTGDQTITIQTWGFGGGTNANGALIAPGGFDPFFAVFSGIGDGAAIVTDGMGNPFGTSDVLSNFAGFAGCPPAGTQNINGDNLCDDITMVLSLAPGTYTLVLSDADYIANAVFDNGTLGEGFTDFTGGVFQTCNGIDLGGNPVCANDSVNWAFDITSTSQVATPEPGTLLLLATGFVGLGLRKRSNGLVRPN